MMEVDHLGGIAWFDILFKQVLHIIGCLISG